MKKLLFLFLSSLALISCTEKVRISELSFKEDIVNRCIFVYKDGDLFSGSAWSNDNKTMQIKATNGVMDDIVVYHQNGNVAMRLTSADGATRYDEDEKEIDLFEFTEKYPELTKQVRALVTILKDNTKH